MRSSRARQAALVGALARGYARLFRVRAEHVDGLFVCSGLPRRAFPRGGVTWGDTYVCGAAPLARAGERLRHERVHVQQWRRHGLWFAVLYVCAGRDPLRNRFEVEAGLQDGGYRNHDEHGERTVDEVAVGESGIRLGQLLKLANLADSGGEAKQAIEAGDVKVNDAVETRRGAQLRAGDVVECRGRSVRLT